MIVLDAPSNLGLRPPVPGTVPGCYKLAGAIRDQGFLSRVAGVDAGYVVPPRYEIAPGDATIYNADGIASYTRKLADRVSSHLDGDFLVVLGGDCSVLFGPMLALRRRGRYGLAYLDASADFLRMLDNGKAGIAAGETLALVTGRGEPSVSNIDGLAPYVEDSDVVVLGNRTDDEDIPNLEAAKIPYFTAAAIQSQGPAAVAAETLEVLDPLDGFWIHLDADILDIDVMPAADAPDPGGIDYPELIALLTPLVAHPRCLGLNLSIYDPDLDPDARYAAELTDALVTALSPRIP
jgi:arginase